MIRTIQLPMVVCGLLSLAGCADVGNSPERAGTDDAVATSEAALSTGVAATLSAAAHVATVAGTTVAGTTVAAKAVTLPAVQADVNVTAVPGTGYPVTNTAIAAHPLAAGPAGANVKGKASELPKNLTGAPTALISPDGAARVSSVPDPCRTAVRDPNTDWRTNRDACRASIVAAEVAAGKDVGELARGKTAAYCAQHPLEVDCNDVAPSNANLNSVPVWSPADIQAQFRATRDARFMTDSSGFPRRLSWLYPDDGCWIRAEMAARSANEAGLAKPYKLFSFGNLRVTTNNKPSGYVTWGWHVVPIVRSSADGQAYVLDAAIDPTQPLPWQTWLLKQVASLNDIRVTVANSEAYGPWSNISGDTAPSRATTISDLQGYLNAEWSRQSEFSPARDAVSLLSFYPPWANVGRDFNLDRKSDILWYNASSNRTTQAWYMDTVNRTGWSNFNYRLSGGNWKMSGVGDFDRDGKVDAVWHDGVTGQTAICYMNGTSIIGTVCPYVDTRYPVLDSNGWYFAGTGDFNYDQRPDIIWRNPTTGGHEVWYLNDALTLTGWVDFANPVPISSGWRYVGTGDYSRDGKIDILWHNSGGTSYVWYLNGTSWPSTGGWIDQRYSVPDSTGWRPYQTTDMDYNNKADILWHHSDGTLSWWYMDGLTMTSNPVPGYSVPDSSGWVEVAAD